MPTRIPASERTSQKLDELLTQGVADGDARTELLKLAVRKIVEEALEAEVAEAVGRGYYENGAAPGAGYRNGYRRSRLPTAEGAIEYGVPSGGRSAGAVRVAGARRAGGAHGRAGAPGRGDVRPRAEHAGHRSGLPRRDRRHDAEPLGGEPGHRAAVAGVRSLRHPGSERVRRRLPVRGWRGRAAARRAAARGGAVCVGHHRGRPQGVAPPGARHEGGHGELYGVLRGPQAPRPGRPAAGRHRRGAGADPGRRDLLPPGPAPALSGPPAAEPAQQGARPPVARDRHPRPRLLRGRVAGAGHAAARRLRPDLRARAARGGRRASGTTSRPVSPTCAFRSSTAR